MGINISLCLGESDESTSMKQHVKSNPKSYIESSFYEFERSFMDNDETSPRDWQEDKRIHNLSFQSDSSTEEFTSGSQLLHNYYDLLIQKQQQDDKYAKNLCIGSSKIQEQVIPYENNFSSSSSRSPIPVYGIYSPEVRLIEGQSRPFQVTQCVISA